MEEYENESIDMQKRQEALQKFRASLSQPLTERFYTEDELIDLFDFASDFNDDYLRMEVLMCAARFYPTSEDLLQRKAIFYSQYSDEARDKCLDDNKESRGIIWEIMRGYPLKESDSATKRAYLQKIIDEAQEITDEDIIQFVNLVYTFEEYLWLKENIELIGQKAVFRSVVLYEVATYAENEDDTDFAITILEELTELEPYNPDFWLVLSRNYLKKHDMDKAISSLDYTIALNPQNVLPRVMKGRILYMIHQDEEEVLDIVKQIKKDGIENSDAMRMEAAIYAERGDVHKLINTYNEYLTRHPEDLKALLPDLVDVVDNGLEELLDRIFEINGANSEEEWLRWARLLCSRGLYAKAGDVILAYFRNSPKQKPSLQTLEDILRMGLFDVEMHLIDIYDAIKAAEKESSDSDAEVTEEDDFDDFFKLAWPSIESWRVDIVKILTLIKTGHYLQANDLAKTLKRKLSTHSWMSPDEAFQVSGMTSLVKDILKRLKKAEATNMMDTYDPFGYWENPGFNEEDDFGDIFDDVFSDDILDE